MVRKMAISAIEVYDPSGSKAHLDLVLTFDQNAAKSFQVRILEKTPRCCQTFIR